MLFYWQNELIQEWQRNCNLGHANYSKPQVSPENIGEQPYFIWKKKLERDTLNPRPLEESKSSEWLSCRSHRLRCCLTRRKSGDKVSFLPRNVKQAMKEDTCEESTPFKTLQLFSVKFLPFLIFAICLVTKKTLVFPQKYKYFELFLSLYNKTRNLEFFFFKKAKALHLEN